jgi:hypothetical protein
VAALEALLQAATSGLERLIRNRGVSVAGSGGKGTDDMVPLWKRQKQLEKQAKLEEQLKGVVHHVDVMRSTALHIAVTFGQAKATELLVDAGSDIEHENTFGQTPLHAACRSGKSECAIVLIKAGVNIQARSAQGKSPLNLAAKGGSVACIRCLLQEYGRMPIESLDFHVEISSSQLGTKESRAGLVAQTALKQVCLFFFTLPQNRFCLRILLNSDSHLHITVMSGGLQGSDAVACRLPFRSHPCRTFHA